MEITPAAAMMGGKLGPILSGDGGETEAGEWCVTLDLPVRPEQIVDWDELMLPPPPFSPFLLGGGPTQSIQGFDPDLFRITRVASPFRETRPAIDFLARSIKHLASLFKSPIMSSSAQ